MRAFERELRLNERRAVRAARRASFSFGGQSRRFPIVDRAAGDRRQAIMLLELVPMDKEEISLQVCK